MSATTTEQIFKPTQKVKVYIPDNLPDSRDVLDRVTDDLSATYGGATEVPNNVGSWLDESGQKVEDSITIIESITDEIDATHLGNVARYVKDTLEEDAVLIEVEQVQAAFY